MKYITKKGNKFEIVLKEYQPEGWCGLVSDVMVNGISIGEVNGFMTVESICELVNKYCESKSIIGE